MNHFVIGGVLIACGILYQFKPNIFKRWFWKKTSIAQRLLGPEAYVKYMRGLGIIYILSGIAICVYGLPGFTK